MGDVASGAFAVRYLLDGRLVGALSCGRVDALDEARQELATGSL